MIALLFLLLIVPLFYGFVIHNIISPEKVKGISFFFTIGFLVELAIFSVASYFALFKGIGFTKLVYIVFAFYLVTVAGSAIYLIFSLKTVKEDLYSYIEKVKLFLKENNKWLIILLFALCAYQIFRLGFFESVNYRDSKTYNAIVNDIVSTNIIYGKNPDTGAIVDSPLNLPIKYILSQWYVYLAMLAKTSDFYATVICNTLIPVYLLILSYFVIWSFGKIIFNENTNEILLFTFFFILIRELTFLTDASHLFLRHPEWGKSVLNNLVVPAVFILFQKEIKSKKDLLSISVISFLVVVSGCALSTMAVMVLPIEIGLITFLYMIGKKKIYYIVNGIISMIPLLTYVAVYLKLT